MVTHSTFAGFAMTRAAWFFNSLFKPPNTTLIYRWAKRHDLGIYPHSLGGFSLRIKENSPVGNRTQLIFLAPSDKASKHNTCIVSFPLLRDGWNLSAKDINTRTNSPQAIKESSSTLIWLIFNKTASFLSVIPISFVFTRTPRWVIMLYFEALREPQSDYINKFIILSLLQQQFKDAKAL